MLFSGLGDPCQQPFPPNYFAHDPDVGCDTYPFDLDLARSLMADAGYADGFQLELLLGTTGNSRQVAEAVQSQLAEIDVDVSLREVETGQIGDIWLARKESDMLVGSWGGRPHPLQTLFLQYHPEGFSNTGNQLDEQFLERYEAALEAPDDAALDEGLRDMSGVVATNALDLVLWYREIPSVFQPAVVGAQPYVSGKQEFRGVGLAP